MGESQNKSTPSTLYAFSWYHETYKPQYNTPSNDNYNQTKTNMLMVNSLSGEQNPRWRSQVGRSNATTSMGAQAAEGKMTSSLTYLWEDVNPNTPVWKRDWVADGHFLQKVSLLSGIGADSSLGTTVSNGASQRLYSRLSALNGITVLGELRQAVQMIRNPALGLRRGIDRYYQVAKKLREREARLSRSLRATKGFRQRISDLWLEAVFGWRPLLSDIEAGVNAYYNAHEPPAIEKHQVSFTADKSVSEVYSGPHLVSGYYFYLVRSSKTKSGCELTAGVRTSVNTSTGPVASVGLVPENFIPAAWELIPWSFLIDYFVNIGAILDAWAIAQRTGFAYVSQSIRHETVHSFRSQFSHMTAAGHHRSDARATITKKSVSRGSPSSVPLPSLALQVKLGTSRGLNIAALFQGRVLDGSFVPPRRR